MAAKNPAQKRLSRKQARLARERVKDPDATLSEIAQRAGYAGKSQAKRALDKPNVQARVRALLDVSPKLRVTALLRKLEEGLEAGKTEFFPHEVTRGYEPLVDAEGKPVLDGKGKPKMQAVKTLKIITRDTIDFGARHRYLDTALELHGLKDKKIELAGQGGAPVTVQIVSYAMPKPAAKPKPEAKP